MATAKAKGAARVFQQRLGARMRQLREERDLTQEVAAARMGISQKYLSELERGQKAPSLEALVGIAHNGFQLKVAALMFGIDDDAATEARNVADLLAGRPREARADLLRGIELLLRAGEASRK